MNTLTPTPSTLVRKPDTVLKQVFGYSEFRDGQKAVIDAAINGQDSLGYCGNFTAYLAHARPSNATASIRC